jgi:nitric oxide synthase-interacting protein
MTRHGNNATNSSVYTYHERKKDQKASGYGLDRMRLGKDAVKGFDCCSLTLQPTAHPVISPDGWIFDKESILKFILEKKNTYNKKMKEYERQKKKEVDETRECVEVEKESEKMRFEETEKNIVTKRVEAFKTSEESTSVSNMTGDRKRQLPSFWMPSMTPKAKKTKLEKPDKTIYCPMSRNPIKMKDFTEVKWTFVNDPDEKRSMISRDERYQCAVTGDVFNNSSHCAVLKPTGHVVTVECVNKIIKKDWTHPLTGQSLTEDDIIYVQRGATGYSAANDNLIAEKHRPTLAIA